MTPRPATGRRARAGKKSEDDPDRPLALYRKKRDFERTREPRGRRTCRSDRLSYCVQKHAASSLHYDFRLELDGVLKSWSVPKGPSVDPADKRLAVQVEDHPVEYGSFEGLIPEGSYGAGTVMLWDRGTWEPLGDARAGFEKGSFRFRLHGTKLGGAWHLVRMGRGRNWLLVKERDELARANGEIARDRSRSVASERDLATIARDEGGTARQIERARRADETGTVASKARGSKAARPAEVTETTVERSRARSRSRKAGSSPPRFLPPQLATLVTSAPEGDDWLHEVKFDGYRMQCRIEQGRVSFLSRNAKDWSARFPALARSATALEVESALLDGEVVFFDGRGITSFERLKAELGATDRHLVYMVFDLLHLDGKDLTREPLMERKARLHELLHARGQLPNLRSSDHVLGHGPDVYREACRQGLEGIVSKRADAPYRSGRGRDWVKVKCQQRQEFVVAGFTLPTHARDHLGSLILGVHDARGNLVYAGRVGTGFDARERRELRARLETLGRKTSPFEGPLPSELRKASWARPELVAEVGFTEWTRDGRLRHPTFQGLREDKPASEVRRETPAPAPAADRTPPAREARTNGTRGRSTSGKETPTVAGVRLTHPERILYPEQGLTKLDLADYYRRVAERMLPHLRDRPLTLERCPEGTGKSCFFQKHAMGREPDSIEVFDLPEKTKTARGMSVRDLAGIVALVQLGTLAIHIFGSRKDRLERPDRMVFDLDPAPEVPVARLASLARRVHSGLVDLGLTSFPMTTGGKGLHVVVPILRRHGFDELKSFTRAFAERLEAEAPSEIVLEASKAKRKGRIFLDTLRNVRGATAVCPYSTRARSGAPVAAPITWDELETRLSAPIDVESIDVVLKRPDPWRGYFEVRQSLPNARSPAKRPRRRAAD